MRSNVAMASSTDRPLSMSSDSCPTRGLGCSPRHRSHHPDARDGRDLWPGVVGRRDRRVGHVDVDSSHPVRRGDPQEQHHDVVADIPADRRQWPTRVAQVQRGRRGPGGAGCRPLGASLGADIGRVGRTTVGEPTGADVSTTHVTFPRESLGPASQSGSETCCDRAGAACVPIGPWWLSLSVLVVQRDRMRVVVQGG